MPQTNRRPGVYSVYDTSSSYSASRSRQYAALVARLESEEELTPVHCTVLARVQELFGPEHPACGAARILFGQGVSTLVCIPWQESPAQALETAAGLENIGALVCDCTALEDLKAVALTAQAASQDRRERVAFCGVDDPEAAAEAAQAVNSERLVLCCPGCGPAGSGAESSAFYTAAAVAGAVLSADQPAYSFNGLPLATLNPPERMPEEQVQRLLEAGVTLVEPVGGQARLIRALTTRTATGGVPDRSMTGLNTVLIIDDVMQSVRDALELRLQASRMTTRSLDSILAQVTLVLADKQDLDRIESFETPLVYSDDSDPSICVVELSFRVAHVLSQIHITAHIQV